MSLLSFFLAAHPKIDQLFDFKRLNNAIVSYQSYAAETGKSSEQYQTEKPFDALVEAIKGKKIDRILDYLSNYGKDEQSNEGFFWKDLNENQSELRLNILSYSQFLAIIRTSAYFLFERDISCWKIIYVEAESCNHHGVYNEGERGDLIYKFQFGIKK